MNPNLDDAKEAHSSFQTRLAVEERLASLNDDETTEHKNLHYILS